ncbi:MAG: CoA transferase [Dehalococcoidia bacterium]|nr:CoA transferase [Dehalococcoidia bacterium]
MPKKLLEDVKIADFTWALVGPISTKPFSDYGAQVIKIEGRTRPDSRRASGPFKDDILGLDRSGGSNPFSSGKMSLGLNLAHPKGLETAKRLVAWADVVVENFAGGAMERMGLGYRELVKIKPDIIMLSSCIMGQTGPLATHRGAGLTLTALAGFNSITGWPDREPVSIGFYTDFIGPYFNTILLLAALDYRLRTGKGQYFDVSQLETSAHMLAPLILDWTVNGRSAQMEGNSSPYSAPHGAYRCRGNDRWCAIAVSTEEEWHSFCLAIGSPGWTKDRRFGTHESRKEHETELDRLVESFTVALTPEEVQELMQSVNVPAGILRSAVDLVTEDPQLTSRGFWHTVDHPDVGKYIAWRMPFILSKSQCEVRRAPLLGEHNEYVCKEILGMSDEEVSELVVEGVLE